MVKYNELFKNSYSISKTFIKKIKNLLGIIAIMILSLFKRNHYFNTYNNKNNKIDILFISHFLNKSQIQNKEDFYFGNIPSQLTEKNYTSLIALINQSGSECDYISSKWKDNNKVPRIILSKTIGFVNEFKILLRLIKESKRLKIEINKENNKFQKKVLSMASNECLSNRSMINLRIAFQIKILVKKFNPKYLIITHEGHSFERIIFSYAREANKEIKCIGYQHANVFRLQHAICRNLKFQYNPDAVFTSGINGKSKLKKSKKLNKIFIEMIGSNRSFNRNYIKYKKNKNITSQKQTCLVIPEGLLSECFILFDFSLNCAKLFPNIKFIWRLHPGIDFDIHIKNKYHNKLPRNIIISKQTLEKDFSSSNWALYRGTTTIIQALISGIKPIYLKIPFEINIDPLHKLKNWHAVTSDANDFGNIINNFNLSKKWKYKNWNIAKKYCCNFYEPLNINKLTRIINKI